MTQIHKALSHYWHLRDQGKSQAEAREHVRLRFGVLIDPETPLASTSEVVSSVPPVGTRLRDCDGDLCTVVAPKPTSFSWSREGEFLVEYDTDFHQADPMWCNLSDIGPEGVSNGGMGFVVVEA